MAENKQANKGEKAVKIRRKPERESVLSPIFAASREAVHPAGLAKEEEPGAGLIQRQADDLLQGQAAASSQPAALIAGRDFSKVPAHPPERFTHSPETLPSFGWGAAYRPAPANRPSWGKHPGATPAPIQRVPTDFGDFNDKTYNTLTNKKGKEIGVEIFLEFVPNAKVDAKLIGLTQALKPTNKGMPNPVDIYAKKRMVKEGVGKGWYIDQAKYNRNPMYAVENAPATDVELGQGATPAPVRALSAKEVTNIEKTQNVKGRTHTGWGEHGFHFKDAGVWKTKNPELYDSPMRPARGKNAGQVFETTALALDGAQKGTYYGSVEWGWKTDDAGVFEKLPLKVVSMGIPSEEFMAAAQKWNTAKTSKNKTTLPLPIAKTMKIYTNSLDVMLDMGPFVGVPRGVKYDVLEEPEPMVAKIKVTEGPYTGQQGYINTLENI